MFLKVRLDAYLHQGHPQDLLRHKFQGLGGEGGGRGDQDGEYM